MFRKLLFAGGVLFAAEAPGLSVTIYNSNLALVEDVRQMPMTAGRQRLEFRDVSAQIRPETVALSADGVSIIEQNFDFDLLTPSKMMEKAVGQQVRIVRTNPGNGQETTEVATVLAANEGVVLKIGDRIEVLRDDGVPTRVIFDRVPENLRALPTLSVTVNSARPGARLASLSYLTRGLAWKTDYVALFDEKAGKLDLQGWITLTNTSGVTYAAAETQLVAGAVNLSTGTTDYRPSPPPIQGVRQAGAERRGGPGEALGDYYIYRLPERTTIAENQTKQVSFLEAMGVSAHKVYQWTSPWMTSAAQPSSAQVVVDFINSQGGGLGAGLPSGIMRVYQRDLRGDAKFVGEAQIGHTPQGSELAVRIGDAFDVSVQPTLVSTEVIDKHHTRHTMSYLLRNARDEAVTVELRQGGLWGENKVIKESLAGRVVDSYTRGWSVSVPATGDTTVTATIESSW